MLMLAALAFTAGAAGQNEPSLSPRAAKGHRQLIAMGNNFIYLFDAEKAAAEGTFENSIIWKWDAKSIATIMNHDPERLDFIDECKVLCKGKKLLITGAHGWSAMIRRKDGKPVFWSKLDVQAHSAEVLPGNRVVVACSVPHDQLHLYDIRKPDRILQTLPLHAAHGVFYSKKYKLLFAAGGKSLNIYRLENWKGKNPQLVLEKSISTEGFVGDIHDLQMKDEDTLILTGNNAAFYDIPGGKLVSFTRFNGIKSIKSINYNQESGEIIYTYSNRDIYEGDYDWAQQKVRSSRADDGAQESIIRTPGINGYKVRVYKW